MNTHTQTLTHRHGGEAYLVDQRLNVLVQVRAEELGLCFCQQDRLVGQLVRAGAAAVLLLLRLVLPVVRVAGDIFVDRGALKVGNSTYIRYN